MADSTSDDNSVLLVHAYLDGELDAANALEIAQRMSTDPALAAEGERVKALQQLIHERLPREVAPPDLRARIEASVGGLRRPRAQPSWRALAASIALTAVVASSSTWFIAGSQPTNTVAESLVSDHIRALMAPQPTDVASSDRHTVKPWFNGRIPESPRVVDLAKADYPAGWGTPRRGRPDAGPDAGVSPRQASYQPHRNACRRPIWIFRRPPRHRRLQFGPLDGKWGELLGDLRPCLREIGGVRSAISPHST